MLFLLMTRGIYIRAIADPVLARMIVITYTYIVSFNHRYFTILYDKLFQCRIFYFRLYVYHCICRILYDKNQPYNLWRKIK